MQDWANLIREIALLFLVLLQDLLLGTLYAKQVMKFQKMIKKN
ncbi:hypothetical protein LBGG_02266 [Lactobacillus gasseri MV-22]|nr:hypothetical protein LBGG_02266 [Lactobacillus gasseri MV-22]